MIELDAETFDRMSALKPSPAEDDWDTLAAAIIAGTWVGELTLSGELFREAL
jgi:hypothetical protein